MKYGIQVRFKNGKTDWMISNGSRIEFDKEEQANKELRSLKKNGWWPSYIRYSVKEIETVL